MKTYNLIPAILLVILFVSCDRKSCETDNPIFLEYTYNDQQYKAELADQIEAIGQENLSYWLHDYIKEDINEYLLFYVQNDSLCAEILMKMEHWDNLEFIQKNKGVGSRNAEFRGLTFTINKSNANETEFIYKNIGRIID
jgi:hypothetical protein